MKIYFFGHDHKYAVEQMLLTMMGQTKPEYPDGEPAGDRLEVSLSAEDGLRAGCLLVLGGSEFCGEDAALPAEGMTELELDRVRQRLVKNAVYRAFLAAGYKKPAWGALTGVRPGKLLYRLLSSGTDEREAVRRFEEQYDVSPVRAELCLAASRHTLAAEAALEAGDVCLYVGIPFCPTRCAYCSFVSQSVEKSMGLIPPFLEALEKEIFAAAAAVREAGLRPVSIYMGGGTPTTLSADQLDRLCSKLEEAFDLSAVREYTVEAGRPDTITTEKLRVLRAHGVDRVSVNPQTMTDSVLEAIGRRHSAEDIVRALGLVRECGGFAVNMDLIAGLPTDTVEGFGRTLDRVLELGPENITVHTLSLKKGSRIMLENSTIPTGEEVSQMLDTSMERLSGAGYGPYYLYRQKFMSGGFENVGWSKPGFENLYNICIMEELCSIIAMGGGGSTKLVFPGDAKGIRIMAPKYPQEYITSVDRTCAEKTKIIDYYKENGYVQS